jgi:D-psicose/D-tagatose/L-ribulose 3-epimerase
MKLGVNTFIWGASFGPTEFHLLPAIKAAGFDGIEMPILDPASYQATAVGRELDRIGLERTACGAVPPGSSLGSSDRAERDKAKSHLRACIDRCAEVGAKQFSGPFYTPVGHLTGVRRTADEWKWTVESWQELAPVARGAGVAIGLEPLNRFETYFLNTAADAVALCDAIGDPAVGILLDTFHANIEEKSIAGAIRAARRHLKHFHISENDRGTPGSGHVEWRDVFHALREIGYDRWLTIESFGFAAGPMSAAAAIWRDLAATPEAIAFEGMGFLKRSLSVL